MFIFLVAGGVEREAVCAHADLDGSGALSCAPTHAHGNRARLFFAFWREDLWDHKLKCSFFLVVGGVEREAVCAHAELDADGHRAHPLLPRRELPDRGRAHP